MQIILVKITLYVTEKCQKKVKINKNFTGKRILQLS